MKSTQLNNRKNQSRRGQGMTEYIIIVSLIAIASIGITGLFGDNIRRLFGAAADGLAGADSVANPNTAGAAQNKALTSKTMANYARNNSY